MSIKNMIKLHVHTNIFKYLVYFVYYSEKVKASLSKNKAENKTQINLTFLIRKSG